MATSTVLVFDNGSGSVKAGFSGDQVPKVIVPTNTGLPQVAIERGVVKDWKGMEEVC